MEMPILLPMRVTQIDTVGGCKYRPLCVVVGPLRIPARMLQLIDAWRLESIQEDLVVEALFAYKAGLGFRVAVCVDTEDVLGCEVTYEHHRWVWIRGDCDVVLIEDWFN